MLMKPVTPSIDEKTIPNWFRMIQVEQTLGGECTPARIAMHTGLALEFVQDSISNSYYQELRDAYFKEQLNLWSQLLAENKADFDAMLNALVPAAIMRLGKVIESGEEKNAVNASSEILDRATSLSRPADVHVYEHRFSTKELDEARSVARSLKPKELPEPSVDAEVIEP